ncbi:MAG: phosphate ABC transporter permease PstA [Deltaproteobacteria bacterium]|nr:phosphate ABC transporter permease PstA [Deltaproteobacteria bacterium]
MWFRLRPSAWLDAPWRWRALAVPRDAAAHLAVWGAALAVAGAFSWILADVLLHGAPHLSLELLSAAPADAGREGGIAPILVSTLLILGVCLGVAMPLGLGSAVLLAEFSRSANGYSRLVRRSLDVLAGLPSIVFGLFGYAFFCHALGLGFSILSGGLTLACMVLPVLIRSVEAALRAVPDDMRAASAALGPAAAPGLAVGLILGTGRALAETAALLFTSGYVVRMPESLLDSGRALSVHIYDLAMNVPGGDGMAYASALVLLGLLVGMNALATELVQRWQRRKGLVLG